MVTASRSKRGECQGLCEKRTIPTCLCMGLGIARATILQGWTQERVKLAHCFVAGPPYEPWHFIPGVNVAWYCKEIQTVAARAAARPWGRKTASRGGATIQGSSSIPGTWGCPSWRTSERLVAGLGSLQILEVCISTPLPGESNTSKFSTENCMDNILALLAQAVFFAKPIAEHLSTKHLCCWNRKCGWSRDVEVHALWPEIFDPNPSFQILSSHLTSTAVRLHTEKGSWSRKLCYLLVVPKVSPDLSGRVHWNKHWSERCSLQPLLSWDLQQKSHVISTWSCLSQH